MEATLSLFKDGMDPVRTTDSLLNSEVGKLRSDFEGYCSRGTPLGGVYEIEPTMKSTGPKKQWILVRFEQVSRIEVSEG